MNRHVGASFTLSVLCVVFFAVILYEPEHPRPTAPPAEAPEPATDAPPPTPGVPLTEATSDPLLDDAARTPIPPTSSPRSRPLEDLASAEPAAPTRISTPPPDVSPTTPRPSAPDPPSVIQVVSRRQAVAPGRHPAFTQVGEGESLTDVALRVYGTSEAATALWRANRDIIARRETPLEVGLVLRTP
jgi:hypothetical protein